MCNSVSKQVVLLVQKALGFFPTWVWFLKEAVYSLASVSPFGQVQISEFKETAQDMGFIKNKNQNLVCQCVKMLQYDMFPTRKKLSLCSYFHFEEHLLHLRICG